MDPSCLASVYSFTSAAPAHSASYLDHRVIAICRKLGARRILDLGCGNGALCGALSRAGFSVTGCDPSAEGIRIAREHFPEVSFHVMGVYDDPSALGQGFDAVVSTEVIEHIFYPRYLPRFAAQVLRDGGHLILTTPYHGYFKNLALALSGRLDTHFTALWDGGHIKFWSRRTLSRLLTEEGFEVTAFEGAGRLPFFWKSMILTARKV